MELLAKFVNQSAPSGPSAMLRGLETPVPEKSRTSPAVDIRPIRFVAGLTNQSRPSGPAVIELRQLFVQALMSWKSEIAGIAGKAADGFSSPMTPAVSTVVVTSSAAANARVTDR